MSDRPDLMGKFSRGRLMEVIEFVPGTLERPPMWYRWPVVETLPTEAPYGRGVFFEDRLWVMTNDGWMEVGG